MNQEFETQLQVVQRALGEVVLPALGSAGSHVVEQLHLSIAALSFMQQRLPHARRYYRGTLQRYLDMAEAIGALLAGRAGSDGGGLDPLVSKGQSLLDSPTTEDIDYRRSTADLRARIAALVADARGSAYESALDALVLDHSGPIVLQDRVWCAPLGFELRPDDLPAPDWKPSA
ncbi:MAG: hypothetical protein Q8R44_15950 [Novosphingobium sp.]|nr:hypothetical protein [Novosphingobium sp.]